MILKCLNWINYNQGFVGAIATIISSFAIIFVAVQTCALNEQVALTRKQLEVTEVSLKITNRQLETSLMVTRPFLGLRPHIQIENEQARVCYDANNTGPVPARVINSDFSTWLNGEKLKSEEKHFPISYIMYGDFQYSTGCFTIEPIGNSNIGEWNKYLIETGHCLEIAMCIVYGSIDKNDHRKWQVDIRNVLDKRGDFSIKAVDEKTVAEKVTQCQIDSPQVCIKK
jgi:hypothetical protein